MKQNITLRLDRALLQKARVIAAGRNTSVSRMLGDELGRLVGEAEAYDQARRKALAILDRGLRPGGRAPDREALHDRQGLR